MDYLGERKRKKKEKKEEKQGDGMHRDLEFWHELKEGENNKVKSKISFPSLFPS